EVKDTPEQIVALNKLIIAYAKQQKIPYIDYYTALLADDGVSMIKEYTGDGLHPNLAGYKVMEEILLNALKK
ncbi:MAG: lipase, partial [Bacteroidaceae bacterium]|nr:lipase [Bacteroidaceae bacterium]